ncbi:exotoxin (plasmid) [Serratia marcescens]|nr:exotoxin [Serratia marcescens]BEM51241.1 exotoxin [Serratia marcescens]
MKHLMFSVLLLALTGASSPVVAEPNVRLYGALVAEPCVIPPGDDDIQVEFGSIVDKYLYQNTRTPGQAFEVRLAECDLSLSNTVTVTFLGTESLALPGLLALDGGSVADGVAIGLETQDADPLPINQKSQAYPLSAGGNVIALKAYVKGEPAALANRTITLGEFNAISTFSLEYE